MKLSSTGSVVILILLLFSAPIIWANQPADTSSVLHVLAGASSALLVSALAYPLVDLDSDQGNAVAVAGLGVGGALIAGLTKELLDLSGWGDPAWSDLLLTLGGGLLAGTLVYAVTCLQPGSAEGSRGIPVVYGAFALVLSLPVGESLYRRAIPSLRSRS